MSDFRVTYTETTELEFDLEELKESFNDEWADVLLDGDSDEEFIDYLITEYGISYLKDLDLVESLRDDGYSLKVEKL